jgi:regulator of protease activity HflC (stomatin/prohibitin superfamily)
MEGQQWAALLDDCAKRFALAEAEAQRLRAELERAEAEAHRLRAELERERLRAELEAQSLRAEIARYQEQHREYRACADHLCMQHMEAVANMFRDSTLVTERHKSDERDKMREWVALWHGLWVKHAFKPGL